MPLGQKDVEKKYYIAWVERYMKTSPNQLYQYEGIDVYGARCGIIHRYGVESRLSEQGKCKIFGYHNGSEHHYKPSVRKDMVMISILRFINDFLKAWKIF